MGSSAKYSSDVGTKGGKLNIANKVDIENKTSLSISLLKELKERNVKFSKENLEFVIKLQNGEIIFLENGKDDSGLRHIITEHASQFNDAFGIKEEELSSFLYDTIVKGDLVDSFKHYNGKGQVDYHNVYKYYEGHKVTIVIAENGYILTAYPED